MLNLKFWVDECSPLFVAFCHTTQCHIRTDHNLHIHHNKMSTFNILNIVQTVDNIRHIFVYWIQLSVLCCHCIQWKDSDKIRSIFLFCLQTAHWIIINFGNSDFTKICVMNFIWCMWVHYYHYLMRSSHISHHTKTEHKIWNIHMQFIIETFLMCVCNINNKKQG